MTRRRCRLRGAASRRQSATFDEFHRPGYQIRRGLRSGHCGENLEDFVHSVYSFLHSRCVRRCKCRLRRTVGLRSIQQQIQSVSVGFPESRHHAFPRSVVGNPIVADRSPRPKIGAIRPHLFITAIQKGHKSGPTTIRWAYRPRRAAIRGALLPFKNSYDRESFWFRVRQRSAKCATAACSLDFTVPSGISRISLICLYGN